MMQVNELIKLVDVHFFGVKCCRGLKDVCVVDVSDCVQVRDVSASLNVIFMGCDIYSQS